jgi:DNA repair photolyase
MKVLDNTGGAFKILTHSRYYTENFTFIMVEHYQRCGFRCHYCITESQGKTRPTLPDLPSFQQRLAIELNAFTTDNFMFCVSGSTDPYNELEAEYRYTRHLVDELTRRNRRFSITTKGPLVTRDIDLLQRNPKSDRQKTILSISASRSDLLADLEPQAPPPEDRIKAVHQLAEAGLNTCVLISPWVPEVTDTDRLFSLLPKGITVFVQPLDLGEDFDEPLDQKRSHFSAKLAFGKRWNQNEINRAYIQECNTVGKKYRQEFNVEWRLPITRETHADNSGYLKKLRPGKFDPDQWVEEHFVTPRIPTALS